MSSSILSRIALSAALDTVDRLSSYCHGIEKILRMLSPNLLKHLDLSIGLLAYDYTLSPTPCAPKPAKTQSAEKCACLIQLNCKCAKAWNRTVILVGVMSGEVIILGWNPKALHPVAQIELRVLNSSSLVPKNRVSSRLGPHVLQAQVLVCLLTFP